MSFKPTLAEAFPVFEAKMRAEGLSDAAIAAFRHSYQELLSGSSGMISETSLTPVPALPDLDGDIRGKYPLNKDLLAQTVVLKLNGGLGTSMGLDKAKSLLVVKDGNTFLDLTAKQILTLREQTGNNVRFMLMNSFNTSDDTNAFLTKYPGLAAEKVELLQNKAPKVDKASLLPVAHAANAHLEWCPPGHGDLYTALYGSGRLAELLAAGVKYMFVSNSDNLGATLDADLLAYFASSGSPFMMECAARSEADKKGGHLAYRDGQLVLRESAQCAKADEAAFQDITRHKYFNTNNLWVRLDMLKDLMDRTGGFVPLPTIFNSKTVDPQIDSSTPVFQLETAMGAAIECFPGACAVHVSRDRFAPVKKCSDLLVLQSDAYVIDSQYRLVLAASRSAPPLVDLDDKYFKLVNQLNAATALGVPSLLEAVKLTVKGDVWFTRNVVIKGTVGFINTPTEVKVIPAGVYGGSEPVSVDLSTSPGLGPLKPTAVATNAFHDQRPGTSGLRKKTKVFTTPLYLDNFVQATFNALTESGVDVTTGSLVVGGDGRYFNRPAIQTIVKIAVANGVSRIVIGRDGLLSTPAVSAIIRERGPTWCKAFGSFILTASHNPGGPEEDFGIKYNTSNGGPAPEKLTEAIYAHTLAIKRVQSCLSFPEVDISRDAVLQVSSPQDERTVVVQVIDPTEDHLHLLKTVFDFPKIKALLAREDFQMAYDCMSGVQGPYAHRVLVEELGASPSSLLHAAPLEDFGGHHADPNLTYARTLCDIMGVDAAGNPQQVQQPAPAFGAACDGDADRNMILGKQFFVTPSDSLAIITAHAHIIPFFAQQGGLRAVARSMPTSGAVDRVAAKLRLAFFEVPTGWKFFGNLMDSHLLGGMRYAPMLCGEESFGTGSDHVREKDGLWAVLAWLSILAHYNASNAPFKGVQEIVEAHWAEYGRNYYCRYDYEGVPTAAAEAVMTNLRGQLDQLNGQVHGAYTVSVADEFTYTDPVDHSISRRQGLRVLFADGSRFALRMSGTAGSGATLRLYIEKYDAVNVHSATAVALKDLVDIALRITNIQELTGMERPSVIT